MKKALLLSCVIIFIESVHMCACVFTHNSAVKLCRRSKDIASSLPNQIADRCR